MAQTFEETSFTAVPANVIAAANVARAAYHHTTATSGAEVVAMTTLVDALKAARIDPWQLLCNAAAEGKGSSAYYGFGQNTD